MADLVIEFVSEEIPARMQAGAGRDLARLIESALTTLGVWHDDSTCLLYTSPSPRDGLLSRMPSSA